MSSSLQPTPLIDEHSVDGDHPPSSVGLTVPEEVTTMIQRLRRALSARIDVERIDANREAVQREMALTNPLR